MLDDVEFSNCEDVAWKDRKTFCEYWGKIYKSAIEASMELWAATKFKRGKNKRGESKEAP